MSELKKFLQITGVFVAAMLVSNGASADELSGADTAWILTSTALVLFMTIPGLSLSLRRPGPGEETYCQC